MVFAHVPLQVFIQPLPQVLVHPSVHPLPQVALHVVAQVVEQSEHPTPVLEPEQVDVQKPVHKPLHPVDEEVPLSNLAIGVCISSYFINLPFSTVADKFPLAQSLVSTN